MGKVRGEVKDKNVERVCPERGACSFGLFVEKFTSFSFIRDPSPCRITSANVCIYVRGLADRLTSLLWNYLPGWYGRRNIFVIFTNDKLIA